MGTNLIKYIQDINKSFFTDKDDKKIDNSVTELHMHKILFFLYGGYYKKFKQELFDAHFEAWRLGPVEISYRKNKNDNKELNKIFDLKMDKKTKDQKQYIDSTVRKLLKISAWTLVDASHLTNVWKKAYDLGKRNALMDKVEIQNEFVNSIDI